MSENNLTSLPQLKKIKTRRVIDISADPTLKCVTNGKSSKQFRRKAKKS